VCRHISVKRLNANLGSGMVEESDRTINGFFSIKMHKNALCTNK